MRRELETFQDWFGALLMVNADHQEFGLEYPMGSCCFRDIVRDPKVRVALKDAWKRLIENPQLGLNMVYTIGCINGDVWSMKNGPTRDIQEMLDSPAAEDDYILLLKEDDIPRVMYEYLGGDWVLVNDVKDDFSPTTG